MLIQLTVQNFALIRNIRVDLGPGLNALTGETGAGKSILVDALCLALGERSTTDPRPDKSLPAVVEAVFELGTDNAVRAAMEPYLGVEDAYLILRRELQGGGRSRAWINGKVVNVSTLKVLGSRLVDIHGQFDQQNIFDPSEQRGYLDRLAGISETGQLKDLWRNYQHAYQHYRCLEAQRDDLVASQEGRERTLDLLSYQIQEIERVNPHEGEEEEIKEERIRLVHAEKLYELVSRLVGRLSEDEGSASNQISRALRDLREWGNIDPQPAREISQSLEAMASRLEEMTREMIDYREKLLFDSERLREVEIRLEALETISRKYGGSLRKALEFLKEARSERERLLNSEVYLRDVTRELEVCLAHLRKNADLLTQARGTASQELAKAVRRDLRELGMKDAHFECILEKTDFTETGQDHVEFFFGPNPGIPPKPLRQISSGGEASRVLLAVKRALAEVDNIPVLIFDEIDTNIGGRLGHVVGEKLKAIAGQRQVLVITHLPQIASFADRHLKVEKRVEQNKTLVSCRHLEGEERVRELSQMMSGEKETEISKVHAQEMLKTASS